MKISSLKRYIFFIMILAYNLRDLLVSGQEYQAEFACREANCSNDGPRIRFPFRLKGSHHDLPQPNNDSCGYPGGFDLFCVGNETAIKLPSPINYTLFISQIDYKLQEIVVYSYDNCRRIMLVSELFSNQSTINIPFRLGSYKGTKSTYARLHCPYNSSLCPIIWAPSDVEIQYLIEPSSFFCYKTYDVESVPDEIYESRDVRLTWSKPDCRSCAAKHKVEILGSLLLLILVVTATFYAFTSYNDAKEAGRRIEKFLEDYAALKPSRYSYADIKKITNQFKDKLGEGAHGVVFKGKLSEDVLVAVKILNHSKGNGEEFLNEVSTMGQIHHINVVRLVGYCAEGLKRALVYEFLPNDSLEKYISSAAGSGNRLLSRETMQDIALGIAKGIEYLHQGCDQRILHFDIKPQNILLDHNFKPKISDFGLAKLCSKDKSIVSMTTARGTVGYIAPEVFTKNFGNVSYKSDVYSFGMLLLEIVGGRKNTNVNDENVDEIYYPEWIFNILENGEDHRIQLDQGRGDAKIEKETCNCRTLVHPVASNGSSYNERCGSNVGRRRRINHATQSFYRNRSGVTNKSCTAYDPRVRNYS
ncbi:putative receptor-like protein kinase [Morus notabilis]|uniref:non-specific serine/threonine protein kinase n=1 Tax=Morus notabilis TaxID=981085 RepID=W9S0G9_9ROSA|nr:putative receptor-like protein kinase [Morus notabilis]